MQENFEIVAEPRSAQGKGASRRLRREGLVPGIIYGGGKDPEMVATKHNELIQHLDNEAFYSHILTVKVGNKVQKVVLKDLQRHPARDTVMHADFLRVDENTAVKVNVPIHFINEEKSHGVKMEGGIVQHQVTDIEVSCLPGDIPEYVEVDMLEVKIGDIIHLSDIPLPEGVTSVALALGEDHDLAVASIIAPRGGAEAEEELEAAADEAGDEAADGDDEGGDED